MKYNLNHQLDALSEFEMPSPKAIPTNQIVLLFDTFDDGAPAHTHRYRFFIAINAPTGVFIFPFFCANYTGGNAQYESTKAEYLLPLLRGLDGVSSIKITALDRGANTDFLNSQFETAFPGYYEDNYQYQTPKATGFNTDYSIWYDIENLPNLIAVTINTDLTSETKMQLKRRLNKMIHRYSESTMNQMLVYDRQLLESPMPTSPSEIPSDVLGDKQFPITEGMHAAFFDGHTFYLPNGMGVNTLQTRTLNKELEILGLVPAGGKMFLVLQLAVNVLGFQNVWILLSCYHFVAYGRKSDYPYPYTTEYSVLYRDIEKLKTQQDFLWNFSKGSFVQDFLLPRLGEIIISPERASEIGLMGEKSSFLAGIKDLM